MLSKWLERSRPQPRLRRCVSYSHQKLHSPSAWQVAQARLQDYHTDRAAAAATRAGILWQQYGEQSTFCFHHPAKQRQRSTALTSLQDTSQAKTLVDHR